MSEEIVEEELGFEEAMNELEDIVKQLEKGDATLEKSMALFERATVLRRHCQSILDTYERKVKKIVETEEGAEVDDLD